MGLVGFVSARGDDLAVRYFHGDAAYGLYALAFYVPALLQEAVWAVDRVSLPVFSGSSNREALKSAFIGSVRVSSALAAPLGLGLAAFAAPVVSTIFGDQWRGAVPVLALFAISFGLRAATGLNWGALAMSVGRTRYLAGAAVATGAAMLLIGIPLIAWLGPIGGAVYSLGQLGVFGPLVRLPLVKSILGDLSFLQATWRPLAVSGLVFGLAWLLGVPDLTPWLALTLGATLTVGCVVLAIVIDPALRDMIMEEIRGGTNGSSASSP